MKIKAGGLAVIIGAVLLLLALPAFGQYGPYTGPALTSPVPVQFTGGYTTTWGNNSGDYGAGIYSGLVNGPNQTGIICDDFNDEIYSGETWSANAFQVSTLNSSNISEVLFGGDHGSGYANIGVTGYAEVATLVNMMFNGSSYSQSDISSAIWDITDGGSLQGLDSTALGLVGAVEEAFGGNAGAAQTYLNSLTNLWILTPIPGTQWTGYPQTQEMWIDVPEGGAALLYLLLAGGVCFGAMFLSSRNRFANLASA
jgi:hypothetical protein